MVSKKEKYGLLRQLANLTDSMIVNFHEKMDQDELAYAYDLLEQVGKCGLTGVDFDKRGLHKVITERPMLREDAIEAKRAEIAAKNDS